MQAKMGLVSGLQNIHVGFLAIWSCLTASLLTFSLTKPSPSLLLSIGPPPFIQPQCHGMTSLPLLHPPLATSEPFHLHSAPSASTPLQLRSMLVQLTQLHHAHSQTNHGSTPDPFGPGSHAKGHCLYTLSTLSYLPDPFSLTIAGNYSFLV